jgi:hypothetical protein
MTPTPESGVYTVLAYHKHGLWLFDDAARGLLGEPFVDGMDEIIDQVSGCIPRTHESRAFIRFVFADFEALGCESVLVRDEPVHDGYFYRLEGTDMRGWLCPETLKYFPVFPDRIHFRCEVLEGAGDRRR